MKLSKAQNQRALLWAYLLMITAPRSHKCPLFAHSGYASISLSGVRRGRRCNADAAKFHPLSRCSMKLCSNDCYARSSAYISRNAFSMLIH